MQSIRWRPLLTVVLRLIIVLVFAAAILSKFASRARWAHQFVLWGYPAWGVDATSGLEIAGLIALWIPALARFAIAALMLVLVGAVFTWLRNGPGITAVVPGALFALLVCLAWLESLERRAPR